MALSIRASRSSTAIAAADRRPRGGIDERVSFESWPGVSVTLSAPNRGHGHTRSPICNLSCNLPRMKETVAWTYPSDGLLRNDGGRLSNDSRQLHPPDSPRSGCSPSCRASPLGCEAQSPLCPRLGLESTSASGQMMCLGERVGSDFTSPTLKVRPFLRVPHPCLQERCRNHAQCA